MADDRVIDEELEIAAERTSGSGGPVVDRETLGQPIRVLNPLSPLAVSPEEPLRKAILLMRDHRIGCVLVVERGRLVGIVTERDLLLKLDESDMGAALARPVSDLMTVDPETLSADEPIAFALNYMSDGGYRHVPLVDAEHHPTGVVSIRDVVDYLADCFPLTVFTVPTGPSRGTWRGAVAPWVGTCGWWMAAAARSHGASSRGASDFRARSMQLRWPMRWCGPRVAGWPWCWSTSIRVGALRLPMSSRASDAMNPPSAAPCSWS